MALNHYAQPRMTRDIDIVIALVLKDLGKLPQIFGDDFYFSEQAARGATLNQSSFNVIHNDSLIKVDFMMVVSMTRPSAAVRVRFIGTVGAGAKPFSWKI